MRTPVAVLLLLAAPVVADPPKWSAGPTAEARQRLLKGNYAEARAAYTKLAEADPRLKPAAAVGVCRALRAEGRADDALAALAGIDHPDVRAERSDLLFSLGRWEEADKEADAALADKEDQLLARWTKARVLRDTGRTAEASDAVRWVVRYYSARSNADNDIVDPDELLVVSFCGAENARWNNIPKQFSVVLNTVIADALAADPDFWPAEVLAGQMLLEKFNRPEANKAFDKALAINPKAADALAGKGQGALQRFELTEAEGYADQALKVNPKHPDALRVKAEVYLIAGDWATAEKHLAAAKAVNPRDATTLGRLAACYLLQRRMPEFEATVKAAEGFDRKPAVFYFELADCLENRKRYTQAEGFYQKATALRPNMAGPRAGLGMLYLRLGREKEGRALLAKAFDADPFNVRVANSIKVMNHLDKYETLTTPHYELRYDPALDKVLAEFLAETLEETHAELKRQFGYEPPGRVLIEVFSTHEMFSGRTVGLPDLHTIGACTGNVVAMASPKAKGVKKPFHWGRVIRHELTHIFNLLQTDYLVPHWLTEGLAVRNEQMARPPGWITTLRDRLAANDLFTLDTVMLGFVRPKGPAEWTLAYCQSQLYVEYLTKTYGEECIGKLLVAYKAGKDTDAALQEACGVSQAVVEKGYKAYVAEVVKPYKKRAADGPPQSFEELQKAHEADPGDPDLAAKMADQLFRRGRAAEARVLADAALEKKPGHPLAAVVKARLLAAAGETDGAQGVLEAALAAYPDEPKLLLAAARLATDAKEYKAAAKHLEHGRKVAPLDGDWLEQLARVYKATEETDKLISVLKELIAQDPDELDGRVRLARVSLEANKPEEAEKFARDALHIDVGSEDARKALLEALKAQGKTAEIETLQKRFRAK